jgi:hypothetical protein
MRAIFPIDQVFIQEEGAVLVHEQLGIRGAHRRDFTHGGLPLRAVQDCAGRLLCLANCGQAGRTIGHSGHPWPSLTILDNGPVLET